MYVPQLMIKSNFKGGTIKSLLPRFFCKQTSVNFNSEQWMKSYKYQLQIYWINLAILVLVYKSQSGSDDFYNNQDDSTS